MRDSYKTTQNMAENGDHTDYYLTKATQDISQQGNMGL
jgi:hypothetical protein